MVWYSNGFVVWFTGLPAVGKTTLANVLKEEFLKQELKVEVLDGDEVRKNISADIGFSKEDRERHARRVAYIAKLLSRNGVVTIVSLISPFKSTREYARSIIPEFVEIWVKCSLDTCKLRDPKGLYKKAAMGELSNLTGIQDPYEPPPNPELSLDTDIDTVEQSRDKIINYLISNKYLRVHIDDKAETIHY